jgi:DNA-binding GntR family transcriptional regulator
VVSPVSLCDVQSLFEPRLLLEPPAAEMAADRIGPGQLAELEALARVSFAGADRTNYPQFLEINTRFHLNLVEAAGNERMSVFYARLLAETERVLHMAVELFDHTDQVISDHVAIVEALREKDGPGAREIAQRHLESSRESVLKAIVTGSGLGLLVSGRG